MKFSDMNWDNPDVVEAIARSDILVCAHPDDTVYQVLGRNEQGVMEGKVLLEQHEQHPAGSVRPITDDLNGVVYQTTSLKRIIHGGQVICSTSAGYLFGTFHCAAEGSFIDFGGPEIDPSVTMYVVYAPFSVRENK